MGWGARRESARILRELLVSFQPSDKVVDDSTARGSARFGRLLEQAGLTTRWLRARVLVVFALASGALVVVGLIVAALTFMLGAVCVYARVHLLARANRLAIDRDLPALLTTVASSVRAGMDPLSALLGARDYFPKGTILVREIERIRQGIQAGHDEEALLEGFLSLYGSRDGELFKGCLLLSRRHGGSLAEPLHRITRVVRQRQSFRRKTKAALAMHRMSAIGIALCALAMGALQFGMNPDALGLAFSHPVGGFILGGGLFLISVGLGWMLTMGTEGALQ